MAKVPLNTLTAGRASIDLLNANFALIQAGFDTMVSLNGATPNAMTAALDVNSQRLINLPAPQNNTDAARLQDILDASTALGNTTASLTTIADAGFKYASSNVEGALQELLVPVANLTALRALAITDGDTVYLEAHTNIGTGGEGVFRAVTGAGIGTYTDDNGLVILPAGGDGSAAWLREYKALDVKMFGAVGDGVTDDTIPCNTALAKLIADKGGVLIFPPGDYAVDNLVLNQDLNTAIVKDMVIRGYGARLIPFTPTPVAGAILTISANDAVWRGFSMYGLSFQNGYDGLVVDGKLVTDNSFFYDFHFVDVSSKFNSNNQIKFTGHYFEGHLVRPVIQGTVTSAENLLFEEIPNTSPGDITIEDANSRSGDIGMSFEISHYLVMGGTFLTAQRWGIWSDSANGAVYIKPHLENNWRSANLPAHADWLTATVYNLNDQRREGGTNYIATALHTGNPSTVFATDYDNGWWEMEGGAGLRVSNQATLINVHGTTVDNQKYIIDAFTNSRMTIFPDTARGKVYKYATISGTGVIFSDGLDHDNTGSVQVVGSNSIGQFTAVGHASKVDVRSYAASMTPDHTVGYDFYPGKLTGNITINAPDTGAGSDTNANGSVMTVCLRQDGGGGNTVTWDPVYLVTTPIVTTGGAINLWTFKKLGNVWIEQ